MTSIINNKNFNKITTREDYLDYAKFIGIVLVVFAHVIKLRSGMSGTDKNIARIIYLFHMPLFFVLSGFAMSLSNTFEKIYVKDVKKLLVPYFVWSFIYMSFTLSETLQKNGNVTKVMLERLEAVVTLRGIAPIWFLGALFLSKMFFYYVIDKNNQVKTKTLFFWLIIFMGLSIVGNVVFKSLDLKNTLEGYMCITIFRFLISTFFLIVGYYIGLNRNFIKNNTMAFLGGSGLVFAIDGVLVKNTVNMHLFNIDSMVAFIISGISGSIMILAICMLLPKRLIIREFGKKSFDIMILHYPPIPIWKVYCNISTNLKIQSTPFITTCILIILCYCFSKVLLDYIRRKYNSLKVNIISR